MAARDSDDDIRKYLPDTSAILREAAPARAKAKLAKAQDNPELDAALAQVQPARPSERPSEASPWAAEPIGIAATALPSSLAAPLVVKEAAAPRRKRAPFSPWAKAIAAVIAAVGPATLLWALLVRPNGHEHVDPARAGASVPPVPTMSATSVMSATAPPIPPAPAPSVTAEVDAGANAPLTAPSGAAPVKPKAHPGTRDDPYDAAPPNPAKTADVVAPRPTVEPPAPIPPVVTTAPPTPPPSATATVKPIF